MRERKTNNKFLECLDGLQTVRVGPNHFDQLQESVKPYRKICGILEHTSIKKTHVRES